ncbi:MAG: tetratricopeptide repeat protein [Alphaproteobacteria bacterium]|nr:tetratricopeptide repeat protein [Alphaproteobacteria bacterium]
MTAKPASGKKRARLSAQNDGAAVPSRIAEAQNGPTPPREALFAMRKAVDHYKKGEWAPAAIAAAEAADVDAKYASAFHLLALALDNLGQRHQAFTMYERAIALDPHDPDLYLNIGTAAWGLGLYDGADKSFRAYMEMRPECPKGYNNLAGCLRDKGELDAAIELTRDALFRMPQSAELWNTLGTIMGEICNFKDAITFYGEAQRLDPTMSRAFHNMGHALSHVGPFDDAIANFTRALDLCHIDSERAEILHARGLCYAAMGKLPEAWPEYEERHNPRFSQSNHFAVAAPRWDDEDLTGRKLLVVGEQGLGDEIMLAGLIPDLIERVGPDGKVMIACDHRLVPLFQRSFPQTIVGLEGHTKHNAKPVRVVQWATGDLKPDFYTPMGSPLQKLRSRVEDFPQGRAFLKPDPSRVFFWQDRLAALGTGPFIGICWRSMLMTTQRKKFFSALELWAPILENTGAKFVNLQYGDCKAELDYVRDKFGVVIHNFEDLDLKMNLDDNAALCAALDLVVAAPTAAAALAAATGTETWFLTAGRVWPQLGTDHYPWYSKTRVLTPEKFGDWPALMTELSVEIDRFINR